jgi:hypothetical protein
MRRILLVVAVLLVGVLGVASLAAVATAAGPDAPSPSPAALPVASVLLQPLAGAVDVSPSQPATVSVPDGALDGVRLTGPDGVAAEGAPADDGRSWSTTADLAYGTTYTWAGTATGPGGAALPVAGSFTTVSPADVVRGVLNIGDDRTVGVAAPIEIQFDRHVEDRAAIEKVLKVDDLDGGRGRVGLAARRERRLARALAARGVLAVGHEGHRGRAAQGRRRTAAAATAAEDLTTHLRDRPRPDRQGRRPDRSGCS